MEDVEKMAALLDMMADPEIYVQQTAWAIRLIVHQLDEGSGVSIEEAKSYIYDDGKPKDENEKLWEDGILMAKNEFQITESNQKLFKPSPIPMQSINSQTDQFEVQTSQVKKDELRKLRLKALGLEKVDQKFDESSKEIKPRVSD